MLGLGMRTLKDPHGGGEVVDASGSAQSGDDDRGGGDEIVGEAVVQVTLTSGLAHAQLFSSHVPSTQLRHAFRNIPEARRHH
jgi:hypothetical protein